MDIIKTDVAIIGAGGGGLRAAIAIAEAHPELEIALISKVYPMRSHTVAAEGGAAGVVRDDDSLENHFNDTVSGGDWLCEQDVVEYFVNNATKVGLVPVTVSFELGERLLRALEDDPSLMLEIDVETATVEVQSLGVEERFVLEPSAQHRLVNGLDDIALTLSHADAISAFEARRPAWMPSLATAG